MGCDIHAFLEYRREGGGWRGWGGQFRLDRNYAVFGMLAQVRCTPVDGYQPRGRPSDMGFEVKHADILFVGTPESGERTVLPETAESWIRQGASVRIDGSWVTDPDNHTHSWLTPDEWERATQNAGTHYAAFLVAMRRFQADGYEVRAVFWFDN